MIVDLAGRRLLVVGGASGIGLATACMAAEAGADVAVIDRQAAPDGLRGFLADLRRTVEVNAAFAAAVQALGGLDMLVFCAGIDLQAELGDMSDDAWDAVLDINLSGAMRSCRASLAHFAAAGGGIVLVSSGAGLRPIALRSAYCASKAGLNMLAKSLALELAPRGIRVNALCPGAVETPLFRSGFAEGTDMDAALATVRDRYALQRIAEPEEMARAILFLASDAASYITGAALAADGGRTFH